MKVFFLVLFLLLFSCTENGKFARKFKNLEILLVGAKDVEYTTYDIVCFKGSFYVDDFTNKRIIEYSNELKEKVIYGSKGRGPNEFLRTEGWSVSELGVEIVDSENLKIVSINNKNLLISEKQIPFTFGRSAKLENKEHLFFRVKNGVIAEPLITIFDGKNKRDDILDFSFLTTKPVEAMAVDGFLFRNNVGMIFMAGYKAGYIIAFDQKGKIQYKMQTIDKTLPPKVVHQGDVSFVDPKAKSTIRYGFAGNNNLYLISQIKSLSEMESNNNPIDVYDTLTGLYKYSFYLPSYNSENVSTFAINEENGYLLAYQGQTLVKYLINGF